MKKIITLAAAILAGLAVSAFALASDAPDKEGQKRVASDDAQMQTEDPEMPYEERHDLGSGV